MVKSMWTLACLTSHPSAKGINMKLIHYLLLCQPLLSGEGFPFRASLVESAAIQVG